jgi:hypothetical protein
MAQTIPLPAWLRYEKEIRFVWLRARPRRFGEPSLPEALSRRLRKLFSAACCRTAISLIPPLPLLHRLRAEEDYADKPHHRRLRPTWQYSTFDNSGAASMIAAAAVLSNFVSGRPSALVAFARAVEPLQPDDPQVRYILERLANSRFAIDSVLRDSCAFIATRQDQAEILVDLIGPEYTWNARWRTVDVVGMARGIYEDRAFEHLPLLADALMDAGCNEPFLARLKDGEHNRFRGSWILDMCLGLRPEE